MSEGAPPPEHPLRHVLRTQFRFLAFRDARPDLDAHGTWYLAWGVGVTWLAGVGRYWDNPRADLWQHLGLGSVVYLFVFSLLLWLLVRPLRPERWSFRGVLVFVSLTSLPALLYAIPVELWTSLPTAQSLNVGFLAVVAGWRVLLLYVHLFRVARLGWFGALVGLLSPLVLIVTALALLNLQHVVFRIMGGLRPEEQGPHDAAEHVVRLLAVGSVFATTPLLLAYAGLAVARHRRARRPAADARPT